MARITNLHGAPDSLAAFARAPHYDSGDSDFTVTQLIDSPRIRILRNKHESEIEEDCYDSVFRLIGTAVHSISETHAPDHVISEKRFFIERDGLKISGAVDALYADGPDGNLTIGDFKFTATRSLEHTESWESQLNLYALLVEEATERTVDKLEVYALLRDWSFRRAGHDEDYPQRSGITVPIDLWSKERREEFLTERLKKHVAADGATDFTGEPPSCTQEETWETPTKWAVMQKERKRALRLLDSREDALEFISEKHPDSSRVHIERRDGERIRCAHFCNVSKFCIQWRAFKQRQEEEHGN